MIRLRVCVWGLCLGLSCATPCAAQSAWTIGFGPAALLRTGVIVPVSSRVEVEPFVYVPLGAVGGGVSVRTSTRVYVSMLAASHVLYAQPDWHTQGWPTVSVGSLVGISIGARWTQPVDDPSIPSFRVSVDAGPLLHVRDWDGPSRYRTTELTWGASFRVDIPRK
mgnify:CR=1 FL=1|jgi:hypothetical protein